jgi:hypothetical protein
MTVAGFFSAGMVAVLIAKIYGAFTHCAPVDPGLPACNWERFAAIGGLFGAISLPTIVLRRLLKPHGEHRDSHL